MLAKLSAGVIPSAASSPLLVGTGKDDVHLIIVATAERGLAGAFNTNIVKLAREHIRRLLADGKTVKILTVGRKGNDQLRRDFASLIVDTVDLRSVRQLGYVHALDIAQRVFRRFDHGEFDVATIFYSEFKNVLTQKPVSLQLIPAKLPVSEETAQKNQQAVYEFEPDEELILAELLPRNIATQIYRALLENSAGEQGARMTAMDNATRNAGDMIERLTLRYNRTRQAMITKELIEIISGAEAV
jgi:F-type H+-transporting ATPase subunit gamma